MCIINSVKPKNVLVGKSYRRLYLDLVLCSKIKGRKKKKILIVCSIQYFELKTETRNLTLLNTYYILRISVINELLEDFTIFHLTFRHYYVHKYSCFALLSFSTNRFSASATLLSGRAKLSAWNKLRWSDDTKPKHFCTFYVRIVSDNMSCCFDHSQSLEKPIYLNNVANTYTGYYGFHLVENA